MIKNGLAMRISLNKDALKIEYEPSDDEPLVMAFHVIYYGVSVEYIIVPEDAKAFDEMVSYRETLAIREKIEVLDEAREKWIEKERGNESY